MYLDNCRNNASQGNSSTIDNNTRWILASNANYTDNENDNLDVLKNISASSDSHVQGLIMMSTMYPRQLDDSKPDEQSKFTKPPLLAITSSLNEDLFLNYSWNY